MHDVDQPCPQKKSRLVLITLEPVGGGEEVTVSIDLDRPPEIDIPAFLAKEAELYPRTDPRAHPITEVEVVQLAKLLGVKPTPKLRLNLHVALAGTLQMILKGWRGPRWLRTLLNKLAVNPKQAVTTARNDASADFVARTLLEEIRVDPADPLSVAAAGSRFVEAARSALGSLRVKRGEPGDEVRQLFLEALTQTASDLRCDLRLPPHDDSRGVGDTPFLEFARAALKLLAERGRAVLAESITLPKDHRARIAARLTGYENSSCSAPIKALEKTRATILQEVPISQLLP